MNPKHPDNLFSTLALAILLLFTDGILGQPTYQVPVGTRPRSMGEAFVAVADDGNAIFWNPAGLARLERIQASFAYADLFGLDIDNYSATFVSRMYFIPPLDDYVSFGVGWSGIHTRDEALSPQPLGQTTEALDFQQDQFNFSLGLRLPAFTWSVLKPLNPVLRHLSLGFTAKYLQQKGSLDGMLEGNASGSGRGAGGLVRDFGLLYTLGALPHLLNGLYFGLMINDLGGTQIRHDDAGRTSETILPQNLRWGLSYKPFTDWPGGKIPISDPVVAIDVDDRVHLGLEFWLSRILALRAGWQKDRHTDESPTLSFGLGFKARLNAAPGLQADYALTDSPGLPNAPAQFGGTFIFKDNPRLIRIEEAHINNVYASLYLHYGEPGANVGTVKLKNVAERDTLKARVTFLASQYMLPQQADTVVIEPGRTLDFPLRAVFAPEILQARDGRLTGEVRVAYDYQRAEHASRVAVDFAIYSQNYLTWDDPCKAAAFVTANDPLVSEFVDAVRATKSDSTKASWFTRYERGEAIKLYHALQACDIAYRLDQKTPFPSLRGAPYRRDQITYPAQFLSREKRHGDCDDLAVLYASLLQHAGFSTALVSVPGHLFMMFDTEIDTAQRHTVPLDPGLFVSHTGTLWIPVETTMIPDSSFVAAWRTAAQSFGGAGNWEVFEVAACQSSYPPPRISVAEKRTPSPADFSYLLEKSLLALDKMKHDYFQSFEDSLQAVPALSSAEEIKLRNRYGALLAESGNYERAVQQFEAIHRLDPAFVPAWNNHGNVEFMLGHFARARGHYHATLKRNPFSRGTYLNLAILYQTMIEGAPKDSADSYQRQSDAALLRAAQLLEGETEAACALLGIPAEHLDGKAGPVDWVKARMRKARKFVDTAFRMYVQKKEIRNVPLDRHGPKGHDEVDADRGSSLYWSF